MRKGVILVMGCAALLLAAPAGSDTSQPPFQNGTQALKVLKKNIGGAIALERNAEAQAKAGQLNEAKSELENSVKLVHASLDAAEWMTDPFHDDQWSNLDNDVTDILVYDQRGANATNAQELDEHVNTALKKKTAVYELVTRELTSGPCSVLTNDEGPLKVDNVAQTEGQVTIQVVCKVDIDKIEIEFPQTSVAAAQPDNGSSRLEQNGKVVEEKPAPGAKRDGETIKVITDNFDIVEVVVIHGDSSDYFDDVM
ncbi:MAG TPA: hypothetical protein VFB25_06310 [Gaiellaceae bacterium]|nr:hypothetical protein [Gaiellaceae bacterium]